MSSAQNAGEIAFLGDLGNPLQVTLCGDRACRVRGMRVKLRLCACLCDPLRRSCVSSARNAGEIAFLGDPGQPSAEIVRVESAECR